MKINLNRNTQSFLGSKSFHLKQTTKEGKQTKYDFDFISQIKLSFDTQFNINQFRRKSVEGEIFGEENYSKKWMQQIKSEIPMHRNQKLGKLIFEKLRNLIPKVKYKPAFKTLKNQGKIMKILIALRPRKDSMKISERKIGVQPIIISPNCILQKPKQNKPQLKLFPFNKSLVIDQPLFNKNRKIYRNMSQGEIQNLKTSQFTSSPELKSTYSQPRMQQRLSMQLKGIYGIKQFSNIL